MSAPRPLERPRLRPADVFRVGAAGLLGRRSRTLLAGLGIAIGIAAIVTILGLSASSRADLLSRLDRIGTNLLTVRPGQDMFGSDARLPATARVAAGGLDGVTASSGVASIEAVVRRSPYVPRTDTGGISVLAADVDLAQTLGIDLDRGAFLDRAMARTPSVVLGRTAARRLGVTGLGQLVLIDDRWFTVVGVMAPVLLDSTLDAAALIGYPFARTFARDDVGSPTTIYVRTRSDDVEAVRALLAPTVKPQGPAEVQVSRPSDAITAEAAAKSAFTGLFLGLGAVALLVGGVGIANVMVISVLERRGEIGLRRAIGATRRHIALQFVSESLLLSLFGGLMGSAIGAAMTVAFAVNRGWGVVIPLPALAAGVGASVVIGAIAGSYPALRASRLPPTEALRGGA